LSRVTILFIICLCSALNAQPARTRLSALYDRLEALGLATGTGLVADKPLLVNGKPAIAIVVGDWHNASYQARAKTLIKKIAEEFKIPTLMLEGQSADPRSERRAKQLAETFEAQARAQILDKELQKQFGIEHVPVGPNDYQPGDYSTSLPSEQRFPKRVEGLESRSSEDIFYQLLRIYHLANVGMMSEDLKAENGKFVITVDGKPITESRAVFCEAQRELKYRYGPDFPEFIIPLDVANGNITAGNVVKPITFLSAAQHRKLLDEYSRAVDVFWVKHDLRPRNFSMAHRVADYFRAQQDKPTASSEDLVLVVAGAAHLVSLTEVKANPPSILDLLKSLGVSAVPVYALDSDETIRNFVDPETGVTTSRIFKKSSQ